jgi:DNA-binding transcriptional MocR family regulator
VAFVPGTSFFADGTGRNTARLNFSYCDEKEIEDGIYRLSVALKAVLAAKGRQAVAL